MRTIPAPTEPAEPFRIPTPEGEAWCAHQGLRSDNFHCRCGAEVHRTCSLDLVHEEPRVRIPYQARVSMVVRTRGSPLQVAQAWPNVLDELSLAIWRSTPNSSSLAAVVRLADTLNLDPVH